MKKTVSANLSGLVFIFDEDAYQRLRNYLDEVRSYFSPSEGCDEIMADIENRIAELLSEKVNDRKEVISMGDIDGLINHMGRPEQYVDPEDDHTHQAAGEDPEGRSGQRRGRKWSKRLYRDTEEKVLAGVCAGVAHFFGWDPALVRVAFVLLFFFSGLGLPAYIILWIAVPEARTRAERLEMMGEPVTAKNIGDAVHEEMDNIKNAIDDVKKSDNVKNAGKKLGSLAASILDFIGNLLHYFFKFFGKALGIFLFIMGLSFLCLLVACFTGQINLISLTKDGVFYVDMDVLSRLFLTTDRQSFFGLWGIMLVVCIPVAALVYGGIRLVFGFKKDLKPVALIFICLWIVGLMMTIIAATSVTRTFLVEGRKTEKLVLQSVTSDTLYVGTAAPDERKRQSIDHYGFWVSEDNDSIALPGLQLNIRASEDSSFHLLIHKSARGRSRRDAQARAASIDVSYGCTGNRLILSPWYQLAVDDQWREQRCNMVLSVPQDRSVYLDAGLRDLLHDVQNTSNTWDQDMVNHTWTMGPDGLTKGTIQYPVSETDSLAE